MKDAMLALQLAVRSWNIIQEYVEYVHEREVLSYWRSSISVITRLTAERRHSRQHRAVTPVAMSTCAHGNGRRRKFDLSASTLNRLEL